MPPSRREHLIEAASEVFARRGFGTTSVDDIIDAAGVCRMTLYNHFDSKDELIVEVLRRSSAAFLGWLDRETESRSADPVGRVLSVFDVLGGWFEEPGYRGCLLSNAAAEFTDTSCPARAVCTEHKRAVSAWMRDLCARCGAANPEELGEEMCLLMDGAIVSAMATGWTNAAARARGAARKLLDQ